MKTLAERVAQKPKGWIGVDLDGTLAFGLVGEVKRPNIGAPIPDMINIVKDWIRWGYQVRIFTARAAKPLPDELALIRDWCFAHIGVMLPVTCTKDDDLIEIYDDRAVRVERNTGRFIGMNRNGSEA